jgi:hypothetical protein
LGGGGLGWGMVRGVSGFASGDGRHVGSVRVRPPIISDGVDIPRRASRPQLGQASGSSRSATRRIASKVEPQAAQE